MDLGFTEEQSILRKVARDFLAAEYPRSLLRKLEDDRIPMHVDGWKKMAELGWLGLGIPEEYDGSGGTFMDLVVVLEEMGRACVMAPFLSTVMCAFPILEAGTEAQKKEFLPKLAGGGSIFTMALTEPSASVEASGVFTKAKADGDVYILNGTKLFITDAAVAEYLIVAARTNNTVRSEDGITLFIVDAKSPGVKITPIPTIGDDRENEVLLENVRVPASRVLGGVNEGWSILEKYIERAATAKCAECVGGSDWTFETALEYAKVRVQYGRPIGSFQAMQHFLAEVWTELNHAKRLVYQAAWDIEQGLPATQDVAMAKVRMADGYRRWTRQGVQIHGGIGTVREHDMGLYFRRARQAMSAFGTPDYWREKVAQGMGM